MYSPTYKRTNLAIHFVNLPNKKKKMTTLKIFEFNSFGEHCYVVWDSNSYESGDKAGEGCANSGKGSETDKTGEYGTNGSTCKTGEGYANGAADKVCIIIDPGCYGPHEKEMLFSFLKENSLTPAAVLLTHAHPDHCFGVAAVCREYGIPVYMNENEKVTLSVMHKLCLGMGADDVEDFSKYTRLVNDGDEMVIGPFHVKALFTPGHSAGGMCYLVSETGVSDSNDNCSHSKGNNGNDGCLNNDCKVGGKAILFSGDTLFAGCIGRSDLPGGDYDKLMESIFIKLIPLDGDTDVLPGHGHSSTIADERMKNPFLLPFNEPEQVESANS